ncbi:MAG: transcriptional regulator [Planctomycetota bacterium]
MHPESKPSTQIPNPRDSHPQEVAELLQAVSQLPTSYAEELEPIVQRVVESTRRRKRILSLVQEALSQLRLDTKYLMFDLESTRRERDDLQARIDCQDD